MLSFSAFRLLSPRLLAGFVLAAGAMLSQAASIRGIVTDPTGARVKGATVSLVSNGKPVASALSTADGSFELLTGSEGRFFLLVSADDFHQLETPVFYAGRQDSVEKTLVIEPEWVRQSIVVTATGLPTPQAQTSAATTVLDAQAVEQGLDLTGSLRLIPGVVVSQSGQYGSIASLYVRGGNSTANKVLIDGVDGGDLGGHFDFGLHTATAIEQVEVFRGANSSLYGTDAASSVISLRTPRGTTSFPSLLLRADGGNLNTMREEATLAGTRQKIDYLGSYSWMQSDNDLPNSRFHAGTVAGNLGWQPNAATQLRGTVHYGVNSVGVPNAWDFYNVADNATSKDQNLFVSASLDHQTTASFHNLLRYGSTRKREQYTQWSMVDGGAYSLYGDSLGKQVTIQGANGYSVTGRAILDYYCAYPCGSQIVNHRDQMTYQGDYRFTPHLAGIVGVQYSDARGVYNAPSYYSFQTAERANTVYLASVRGDFANRFFYSLGGSLQHNSLFGTTTSPRAGLTYYLFKPGGSVLSGTRLRFNFGDGVREPSLSQEFGSLYKKLDSAGFGTFAKQIAVGPLAAPTTRSYEGGIDQAFFRERLILKLAYFHNQFGREIESVGGRQLVALMTNLTAAEKANLISALGYYYTYDYGLYMNTQAFRAQGIEFQAEGGIGSHIFLRGGYTYTDAEVQRSFSSDNAALAGGYPTTSNGVALGWFSPLKGARPFRRPPQSGFFSVTYGDRKVTGSLTGSFVSRSDDSTFLFDQYYGSSLTLPNRNLSPGYAKIDLGGSYQLRPWISVYSSLENLANNTHMAPIGYRSLPFTARTGVKLNLGRLR